MNPLSIVLKFMNLDMKKIVNVVQIVLKNYANVPI